MVTIMPKIMMYKIYCCALFIACCTNAQANSFTRLLPKSILLNAYHPEISAFSIAITNSTAKNITFRNLDIDCKCIYLISSSLNNNKIINPKNVLLKNNDVLSFNFNFLSEYYSKSKIIPLFFYFNNLFPAVQVVKLNAVIHSDVIANPEALAAVVPRGFSGKIGEFALTLTDKNTKISKITSSADFINTKFNSNNFTISVFLNKKLVKNTNAWLNVKLTGAKQKLLKLHIREIKFIPDIQAIPSVMNFGIIQTNGLLVGKEVVLKSRTKTPWKIVGSQIVGRNKNAVKIKILPQTNSCVNTVWAVLNGNVKSGLLDTKIIINTDNPFSNKIVIPVKGQVISINKNIKDKK